jgi:predicted ATPase
MTPAPGGIRTPDQRLRVFVSSTLKELAPERALARLAIERLHLAPVMFELGARPHPPRELYRAYLRQSDVFVGLYAERYGWVAPGETVSGLEDEYNLAGTLPKLIYIKDPSPAREPRLTELLNRLRDDDTTSFKYYSTPRELRGLLEADLATLLADRFDQSKPAVVDTGGAEPKPVEKGPHDLLDPDQAALPAPLTALLGRERELDEVERLLARPSVRLVTLLGSGGIGKSRLAVEVASRAQARGNTEVAFVDLSPVQQPALVTNVMAEALGVLDTGDEPLEQKLKTALRSRRMLVVVDNFEQVLSAAPLLTTLLTAAPEVTFLVTSRTLLRVSGEHAVEVGPLELPGGTRAVTAEQALGSPSVALFVERARAVKPDFEVTEGNAAAVAAISVALDGVPLALELAAARVRMLPPAAILARLDRGLALLAGGARDLPARQQTLRSTIEWSTQLLDEPERRLLAQLGVFAGGFSLEAVEAVAEGTPSVGGDPILGLGILVDNSLVREQDRAGRPIYSLLATVREYAVEQLEQRGELESARAAHAGYFLALARSVEAELKDARQREVIGQLNDDRDNLRAVARYLLDEGRYAEIAEFAWHLIVYWWVGGLLGEVRAWMDEVLSAVGSSPDRVRAIALYFNCSITVWRGPNERVVPGLTESVDLFRVEGDPSGEGLALLFLALALLAESTPDLDRAEESLERSVSVLRDAGDGWGEAMALVTLGRVSLLQKAVRTAIGHFDRALALARGRRDDLGTTIALQHLGWAQLVSGKIDEARGSFEESLAVAAQLGHTEGVAFGLEGLTAIAAEEHEVDRAGRLLGASEALRRQSGLANATSFSFHQHYLAPLLGGEESPDLERVRSEGEELSIDEAVVFALQGH